MSLLAGLVSCEVRIFAWETWFMSGFFPFSCTYPYAGTSGSPRWRLKSEGSKVRRPGAVLLLDGNMLGSPIVQCFF